MNLNPSMNLNHFTRIEKQIFVNIKSGVCESILFVLERWEDQGLIRLLLLTTVYNDVL